MTYLNERYMVGTPTLQLSIASRTENSITFAWPMAAGNYVLEQTIDFTNWTPVQNPVQMEGEMHTVTVNTTGTARFFRLKQAQ